MRDFAKASVGACWASGWGFPCNYGKRQVLILKPTVWISCSLGSVFRWLLVGWQRTKGTYNVEVSGKLIAIVNPELAAVDTDVKTDAEVLGMEWSVRTISFKSHLALKECALRGTAVNLLGFNNHDWVVFKKVEDHDEAKAVVFETALDNAFFKVRKKSQDL